MTLFWAIAGAMVLLALIFLLPPLLRSATRERADQRQSNTSIYRSQLKELEADLAAGSLSAQQFAEAKRELARRVLEDVPAPDGNPMQAPAGEAVAATSARSRWLAVSIATALPVVTILAYLMLGNPAALGLHPAPELNAKDLTPEQMEGMLQRVVDHLKKNPADAQGWTVLARAYFALARGEEALAAYAKAESLKPADPHLLTDYAEAMLTLGQQGAQENARALLQRALAQEPNHPKALALSGALAFSMQDYTRAISVWEKLFAQLEPNSEVAKAVTAGIEQARAAQFGGPAAPAAQQSRKQAISGTVTLSPQLADKAQPEDTLFLFAQAANGPKMPLAAIRGVVRELPKQFTLDDAQAMNPALKLSRFSEVRVVARISKSGQARPQSGDLFGESAVLAPGSDNVQIVIDKIVP